jgi:hypothetical protein
VEAARFRQFRQLRFARFYSRYWRNKDFKLMTYSGVYTVLQNAVSVSTAITLVQIKAGSNRSVEILRAWVSQSGSTTSAQQRIQINRKSAAATVTSYTPLALNNGAPTADAAGGTSATGVTATAEGTDSNVLIADAFNVLSGWIWVPTPEERITVQTGGIIGLKFPAAPGSALTINAGITFAEIG